MVPVKYSVDDVENIATKLYNPSDWLMNLGYVATHAHGRNSVVWFYNNRKNCIPDAKNL